MIRRLRDRVRARLRRPRGPITRYWTCPACRVEVPVAVHVHYVAVARVDSLEVQAHVLRHQEEEGVR